MSQQFSLSNIKSFKLERSNGLLSITFLDTYNNKTKVIAKGNDLKLLGGN